MRCGRRGFPAAARCDEAVMGVMGLVLTPVAGDGGARGAAHRSRVSTMIMRPPQQGHGGRWSAATAVAVRSASSRSTGGLIDGRGAAISSLVRAILVLQVALASSP